MAFTQIELDTLDAAIASGATEVRFQDRMVRYNSISDMLKARTLIVLELQGNNPIPRRQIRMIVSSGF